PNRPREASRLAFSRGRLRVVIKNESFIEDSSLAAWVPVSGLLATGQLRESPTAACCCLLLVVLSNVAAVMEMLLFAVTSSSSLNQLRDPLQEPKSAAGNPTPQRIHIFLLPIFLHRPASKQFPVTMATSSVANERRCCQCQKIAGQQMAVAAASSQAQCMRLAELPDWRQKNLTCAPSAASSTSPEPPTLYDYNQQVDQEPALCKVELCQQPLVEPLDTKCGHTFCTPCLKSHLAKQALCPIDKSIINFMECSQASSLVKNLTYTGVRGGCHPVARKASAGLPHIKARQKLPCKNHLG
uniref:RING-type domain-containing protein n=1 Tax=Macrostomum lignano TaxID=282301 RepID=A0A1I8FEE3_9PLAT